MGLTLTHVICAQNNFFHPVSAKASAVAKALAGKSAGRQGGDDKGEKNYSVRTHAFATGRNVRSES